MRRAGLALTLLLAACEQTPTNGLGNKIIEPPAQQMCASPSFGVEVVGHVGDGFRSPWSRAQLGPDGLYYVDERNSGGTLRLEPNGEHTYLAQNTNVQLLDAADGAVLLALSSNSVSIDLWRENERRTLTEGNGNTMANGPSPQVQLLHDGKAVWIRDQSAVEVYDTQAAQTWANLLPLQPVEAPYLRFPYLALTGNNGGPGNRVVLYDLSKSWQTWESDAGEVHNAVITNDALVYLDGTRPTVAPLDSPVRRYSIGDRPCSSLDTDGARVVLACDPEPNQVWYGWLARNHSLWVHDNTNGTREIDLRGRTATLPRIHGDTIAYLSFEETDFCQGPSAGVVVLHDLVSGKSVEAAPITHGCFCCDAIWPDPMLALDGELAAWNYDVSDTNTQQITLAKISRGCAD